jgi:anti-anti-sigma factor
MPLQAHVTRVPGDLPIAILALHGEVNSESVTVMEEHIDRCLRAYGRAVIDLSNTVYVSSAGWRGIMARCSKGKPASIMIACMQPSVRNAYELLGLSHVLSARDTVADAIAALRSAAGWEPPPPARNPRGGTGR